MQALKELLFNVPNVFKHPTQNNDPTSGVVDVSSKESFHRSENEIHNHMAPIQAIGSDSLNCLTRPNLSDEVDTELRLIRECVFDLIRGIRDPEKPETLEELDVVSEENVDVKHFLPEGYYIRVEFVPTVPHCSLASLIGLSIRTKIKINLPEKHKLDIFIKEGTHSTAEEINKQINDKERIAAAMENPNLRHLVHKCIEEEY